VRIEGQVFQICAQCRRNGASKTCDHEGCGKPLCALCAGAARVKWGGNDKDLCKEHAKR
jgi:hypothetical protein